MTNGNGRTEPHGKGARLRASTTPAAIERLHCDGNRVVVPIGDHSEEWLKREDNWDYFKINTDEFQTFAVAGSIAEVWMLANDIRSGDVVLVAANDRLEIRKYDPADGVQVMGQVSKFTKHTEESD